jgi:hypothetical protein
LYGDSITICWLKLDMNGDCDEHDCPNANAIARKRAVCEIYDSCHPCWSIPWTAMTSRLAAEIDFRELRRLWSSIDRFRET